jgi:magnesium transporter
MNFDNLPELHYEYSYFIVLAVMVIVAIGMLWFFWRKGWIGQSRDEGDRVRDE